jgi:hypothetical protein
MCSWHHGNHPLQLWRIFELKAASRAVGDASGVVPDVIDGHRGLISPKSIGGGHGLISPKSIGGEEGPFCFAAFHLSVLFANLTDLYEKTLCNRDLFVTFTAT